MGCRSQRSRLRIVRQRGRNLPHGFPTSTATIMPQPEIQRRLLAHQRGEDQVGGVDRHPSPPEPFLRATRIWK